MRAFFAFFVLLVSINSFSQQKQFQQNIGWKGAGNSITLHSFTNADESLVCLALLRYDSLKAFLLDKNMRLITTIMQDGGGTIYSANSKRELDKTKQFLKKLLAGRAVITVYQNQYNQCEITVGAYKQLQSTSGGWTSFGGGAPVYTGGVSSSWKRVTRFKSIIDTKTLQHISGEAKPSLSDIINDYTTDISIPSKGERLFKLQNNFFYGYYDKGDKSLKVVKL